MAGERVTGSMRLGGAGQLPGGFNGAASTGGAKPPEPQTNPMTYTTPGVYLFGVPKDVTTIAIEQWGAGGYGSPGVDADNGGTGGGGGGHAKATFTAPLVIPGGILTVTVGAGGTAGTPAGGLTKVRSTVNDGVGPRSNGGAGGGTGGAGGSNLSSAGTGYTNVSTASGTAGAAAAGKVGGDGGGSNGGGAGGAGGADTKNGTAGLAPGGGGGGGGGGVTLGGNGADGKVIISW